MELETIIRKALNAAHVRGQNHQTGQSIGLDDLASSLSSTLVRVANDNSAEEARLKTAVDLVTGWQEVAKAWKRLALNAVEVLSAQTEEVLDGPGD